MKPITQEAPMGCAIACCASLAGLTYEKMLSYFDNGEIKDHTSGFYNKDIVKALSRVGINAKGCSIKKWGDRKIDDGTIVFIKRSKVYPEGHFLLKTKKGWMNPWINHPNINPAKAGFQTELPGKIDWVIEIVK
jgi:hypothetical protein